MTTIKKSPLQAPKNPPKPEFDVEKYVTFTLPREEVIEIKQAFDIFD